ncbi:MAG: GTPase domain-containing protein [Tetrasphaera sp.]|nr:GTPase domain-containing protein [Tetrasphaera sp.]
MNSPDVEAQQLIAAVTSLRAVVESARLPLAIDGAADADVARVALLRQLDDYVLARLHSLDAPLLAVVGGSTGAGKSTLVNSIVGTEVSKPGVIRPTTTSPVLVHHPDDLSWFADRRILPGLARATGGPGTPDAPGTVRLVTSRALPAGMALLDAPDIDSVVSANRAMATQLLGAADLWLFVTTAARYADAVPWDLLRTASERGTAVAIVLDRVPPEIIDEIRPHLAAMLRDQGLPTAPIFTVPETVLTADGRLPTEAMARLKAWLDALASDARARSIVVGQTLKGALESLAPRTDELVEASRAQADASAALRRAAAASFTDARDGVKAGMTDGTLLRGEVLARWQEFVGTGEFFRQVESTISRWRDKVTAAVRGGPPPAEHLGEALHSGVAALIRAHGQSAAADTARAWRRLPGGPAILEGDPSLSQPSPEFTERVERLVRDWQGEILHIVSTEGQGRRTNARIAAYGINGVGLFLMLVSFAHTAGLTGAEVGIAGGTSVLAQRVLEAIFGDQAVRTMAAKAREQLTNRVEDLYAEEQARFSAATARLGVDEDQAGRLATAAAAIREELR